MAMKIYITTVHYNSRTRVTNKASHVTVHRPLTDERVQTRFSYKHTFCAHIDGSSKTYTTNHSILPHIWRVCYNSVILTTARLGKEAAYDWSGRCQYRYWMGWK